MENSGDPKTLDLYGSPVELLAEAPAMQDLIQAVRGGAYPMVLVRTRLPEIASADSSI